MMRTHQAPDPTRRGAVTTIPQPRPHLAIAFDGARRRCQDVPDMVYSLVLRTRTNWPRRASGAEAACRCQETVERATPHTRQTRARPYGLPVEGEVAWLIVSTSWPRKGGGSQAVHASPARAQLPWSTRPALRASGPDHGHG